MGNQHKNKGLYFTGFIATLVIGVASVSAAVFTSHEVGIQVGSGTLNVSQSGQNLFYGVVSGSSANGSLIKLEKGSGSEVFRVDIAGNMTKVGSITSTGIIDAGQFCFQGDCKTSWSDVLGGGQQAVLSQNNNAQSANFWISGEGKATSFTTDYFSASNGSQILSVSPPTGKEGIRVVASDYSPFIIRNTGNTGDLLRVDQNGNLTVSGTINNRLIGTSLTNIAVNAGQGTTNVGLSANYIEGHDWAEISALLSEIPATTPEKHYFISSSTTSGNAGGFSGFDAKCNNDTNAISGRTYHVYAAGVTNRGFRAGVVYSNKTYGTFAVTSGQSPDVCRVLGITCDSNWITDGPYETIWNTDSNSCSGWASTSPTGSGIYQPFRTNTAAGTLGGAGNVWCGSSYRYLCIEDSGGTISNPGSVCGNGALEFGEYCDDGNTNDDASCPANCQSSGGYCGDGFNASDEQCDYNSSTYSGTGRCTTSCTWAGDSDSDSYTGQTDCWNNDTNAYPGSPNKSGSYKDMNCDGYVSSETNTWCNNYDYQSRDTNWGQLYGAHGTCETPCEDPNDSYCIASYASYAAACDSLDGTYDYSVSGGCTGTGGNGPGPYGYTWIYGIGCQACTSQGSETLYW